MFHFLGNVILFPFRLFAWILVQSLRLIGLLLGWPLLIILRFAALYFHILTTVIQAGIAVVIYILFPHLVPSQSIEGLVNYSILHALISVFYMSRRNKGDITASISEALTQFRRYVPPALWKRKPKPPPAHNPLELDMEKQRAKQPPAPPPKPQYMAHYGIVSQSPDEELNTIAARLDPRLQRFMGLQQEGD